MKPLTKLNFADQAETVIQSLITEDRRGNPKIGISTSKIRTLLGLTNTLYNQALKAEAVLSEDLQSDIAYVKMKCAYEAGRDAGTREFIVKSQLIDYLGQIGDSREKLLILCRYMESLVAYHKFYGKDK